MALRLACLVAFLCATVWAQPKPSPALPLKLVDGGIFVRAELHAPGQRLDAHVLIDLASSVPLRLHGNSAQVLDLQPEDTFVRIEIEGYVLGEYWSEISRLRDLERISAEHAEALEEVPAVAILGWPVFAKGRFHLDLAGRRMQILDRLVELPEDAAAMIMPDDAAREPLAWKPGTRFASSMTSDPIPMVALQTVDGQGLRAAIGTTAIDTWLATSFAARQGHPNGALPALRWGRYDLTKVTAPRPGAQPDSIPGMPEAVLGTGLLRTGALTFDPDRGRLDFAVTEAPLDPTVDGHFIAAMLDRDLEGIEKLLADHAEHRLAEEAAVQLLRTRFEERSGGPEALERAALLRIKAAPERRRARTAIDLGQRLNNADPSVWKAVRKPLLELALKASESDENAETVHKIRSEIGGIFLEAGDLDEAWRHLLGAAFGLPRDGMVNFRLGRLYEKQGRFERAWSRYLQASVTAEAGADGLRALKRLAREKDISTPFDVDEMKVALEGRVPAFEPASRYRPAKGAAAPTRRVLVELFTGAQCPPCFAADLAVDGVLAHFAGGEVTIVQHHLPIPAPEPLVSRSSVARARVVGVRGTPTVVVGGQGGLSGVGGRTMMKVEPSFRTLRDEIEKQLERPSPFKLEIDAKLDQRKVTARVRAVGPAASGLKLSVWLVERSVLYPGANRIAFHHHVNRASLTEGTVRLAEGAGEREWKGEIRLADVSDDLDLFLDESFGLDAFAMRPLGLPEAQMGLIAVLWSASGRAEQTAYWEAHPKPAEEER